MLTLILALIDRLIALAKKRGEINRELFDDFVQPAFQAFEIVHADYIESMMRYNARLADKTFKLDLDHPVFRDIEFDSLKSEHLRIKLSDFKPAESPEKLKPFLIVIDFYLRGLSATGARSEVVDKIAIPGLVPLSEKDYGIGLGGKRRFGNYRFKDGHNVSYYRSMRGALIFADPMREALRDQLVGYDDPHDLGDKEEWKAMCRPLLRSRRQNMGDEERRRLCANAVKGTIRYFQTSYRVVSYEYSVLRSQLMSPD